MNKRFCDICEKEMEWVTSNYTFPARFSEVEDKVQFGIKVYRNVRALIQENKANPAENVYEIKCEHLPDVCQDCLIKELEKAIKEIKNDT